MDYKVKLIIGNEREIEDKINEALETLPNAELKFPPTPILAQRGLQFSVCIVYSLASQKKNGGKNNGGGKGGEDDNSGENDGSGENNKEADDDADKSGSSEKPDGEGEKTVKP